MDIKQVLDALGIPVSTTVIVLLLTFIKIPKIELNVWGMLGKALSKGLNAPVISKMEDVEKKVDKVQSELDTHVKESERETAFNSRHRILRFSDEICSHVNHSKEHYEEILFSIDKYEKYCEVHPEFPNSKCVAAIEVIKESYKKKLDSGGFLGETKS